jgi:hypothetical protein
MALATPHAGGTCVAGLAVTACGVDERVGRATQSWVILPLYQARRSALCAASQRRSLREEPDMTFGTLPRLHALRRHLARVALVATAIGLTACASSSPVVYSKKEDSIAIDARTQRDVGECSALADQRVGRHGMKASKVGQQAGSAAAVGFVATVVGSVVSNSRNAYERARGAAAAGASGMATKLLLEWNEGDDVFQAYVERCLEQRGHVVLGWR